MIDLQKLAKDVQAATDGPIDFEEAVKDAVRAYGNLCAFGGKLYTVDYDSIYRRHAAKLGREPTDLEYKQAILNAVIEQAEV